MSKADLQAALQPIIAHLSLANVNNHADLQQEMNQLFPMNSSAIIRIKSLVDEGLSSGWLCPREANGIRFGRVCKSSDESSGFVVDAVDMDKPGPGHTHPEGEIDLCFALEGTPLFDGNPPGWTVYPPGSWHIPTVENGRMSILYFLPKGAIRFEPNPNP